jgi:hypothetical protein
VKIYDLMGNDINIGDTIAVSKISYGKSTYLAVGLVRDIKFCAKTIRLYYKLFSDNHDRETYLSFYPKECDIPSPQLIKISGIEFALTQKKFAKLMMEKIEFENKKLPLEEDNSE